MNTTATISRANLASLRKPEGITINDELRRQFPAVFSEAPSSSLTDKYQFYPSYRMIDDMAERGLKLVQIGQQISTKRDPSHQMHVMRFQPDGGGSAPALKVGDSNLELVVLNSHNGRNRLQAYAGIFRLVCLNGMVVSDHDLGQVRTKHFGEANSYDIISDLIGKMADRTEALGAKLNAWSKIGLDNAHQMELARAVMGVRSFPLWLEPDQLLEARREGEEPDHNGRRDLWTTFNVIQENVMKGDIDRTGAGRPSHTRAVTGAFADISTNLLLWEQLEKFSEKLDGGAPTKTAKAPVDEPEVEAAKDASEESAEERRKRLDRERKAAKRAEAKA